MSDQNTPLKLAWIECIRLRTFPKSRPEVLRVANELIGSFADEVADLELLLLSSSDSAGDIGVLLAWRNRQGPAEKSVEGFLLAECFREFGMTLHDVWDVVGDQDVGISRDEF